MAPNKMAPEKIEDDSPVYSIWFGKPVVLLVVLRQCHIPLPCSIIGESAANVRIRAEPGRELNVRKESILAVEECAVVPDNRIN